MIVQKKTSSHDKSLSDFLELVLYCCHPQVAESQCQNLLPWQGALFTSCRRIRFSSLSWKLHTLIKQIINYLKHYLLGNWSSLPHHGELKHKHIVLANYKKTRISKSQGNHFGVFFFKFSHHDTLDNQKIHDSVSDLESITTIIIADFIIKLLL